MKYFPVSEVRAKPGHKAKPGSAHRSTPVLSTVRVMEKARRSPQGLSLAHSPPAAPWVRQAPRSRL